MFRPLVAASLSRSAPRCRRPLPGGRSSGLTAPLLRQPAGRCQGQLPPDALHASLAQRSYGAFVLRGLVGQVRVRLVSLVNLFGSLASVTVMSRASVGMCVQSLSPKLGCRRNRALAPSAWRSAEKQRRQWDTSRSHSDQPWPCASQLSQPSVRDPTRNFVAEPHVSSQHCMSNCICDSTCVFEEPRLCSCRPRHVDIHLHR